MSVIDPNLLARAVASGLLTAAQAEGLDRLARETAADLPPPEVVEDAERLRFVTGFADIFVTLGCLLFLGAALHLGSTAFGEAAGAALVAALSWGLAEVFARRRRMALPSIVLLATFAGASFAATAFALGLAPRPGAVLGLGTATPFAVTLGLAVLHYRRFRVPITVAAGAGALAGTVIALLVAALPNLLGGRLDALVALAGLAIFALAMRYDLSDRARLTRRADIAFWLHLLAAPMMVHPVLSALTWADGMPGAVPVLLLVLGLALVALATDRRAILVSGLAYAGAAVARLVYNAGLTGQALPLSLLALGGFVLVLSAAWHDLRKTVLAGLPQTLAARLPHPVGVR